MKKKKLEKRKRITVRTRDWADSHEDSFTHDLSRHRKALVSLPESTEAEETLPKDFLPNGLVISHSKKWAFVQLDGGERLCRIDERLKERDATLLAPGDRVLVEMDGEESVVRGVGPRVTRLSRPAGAHDRVSEQILAANVDILLIVTAAESPPFREGLVDRLLIAAEVGGVTPIICVNKMDLVSGLPPAAQVYADLGFTVAPTSCSTGDGLPALKELLQGKRVVLSGHSGVGKSSLLNALDPGLRILTQDLSTSTNRGRHTTSLARLYELHGNIKIIDTPGIRALGLWGISSPEVAYYFPDIAEVASACHFRNCTHDHEPDCAVKKAAETSRLSSFRYESYLRIRASMESENGMTPGRLTAKYQGKGKGG